MDTTDPSRPSAASAASCICSPAELAAQLRSSDAPLLIDVRKNDAYKASDCTLPGALRRDPLQVDHWAGTLPVARFVVLYCVHGHEVSQGTMSALRKWGIRARILQGGIAAWREHGLPLVIKAVGSDTRWITRERPKIDRIACPWLVRRFVDADAQFLYVPTAQVRAVSREQYATPYDVDADVADTPFAHEGTQCSFDAFIKIYRLGSDTALAKLADIVRAADTDRLDLAPQAAGLLAVSLGMSRNGQGTGRDHTMLEAMLPVYDALYAWCRDTVAESCGPHNWRLV